MDILKPNIRFYTVATSNKGYLDSLRYTLPQIEILGEGKPWRGYISKLEYLEGRLSQLEQLAEDPDELIVFTDAYDVLFNVQHHTVSQLIDEFNSFNVDILFSVIDYSQYSFFEKYYVEKLFYGIRTYKSEYICNGGLFMGKRKSLLAFVQTLLLENERLSNSQELDDDRLINRSIIAYSTKCSNDDCTSLTFKYCDQIKIGLDIEQRIFHNHLAGRVADKVFFNTYKPPIDIMESKSFFYHFIANQNVDHICKRYNIPLSKNVINSKFNKFKHYISYFYFELITLTIILTFFVFYIFK